MALTRHFDTFTEARRNFRGVLDAAQEGVVTTVTRDQERFLVVSVDDCVEELRRLLPSEAVVAPPEDGSGWGVFLPGVPVHGDADTFDGAIDDFIAALREYAEDWNERLHRAPNHVQHRSLVALIELANDEQLREWLIGAHARKTEDTVPAQRDDEPAWA
jgi:hypothetical protein